MCYKIRSNKQYPDYLAHNSRKRTKRVKQHIVIHLLSCHLYIKFYCHYEYPFTIYVTSPAFFAASIPTSESSNTIVFSLLTLKYSIAFKKPSGSGFLLTTSFCVIISSNLLRTLK